MIDPNIGGGLVGIHIVADSIGPSGEPIRQVIHLEDAEVWVDYDIDFNRYRVRIEGGIPRDRIIDNDFPTEVPPHPADNQKGITDGEEEIIIAELIEE